MSSPAKQIRSPRARPPKYLLRSAFVLWSLTSGAATAQDQSAGKDESDPTIAVAVESIRIDDLKRHVSALASDAFQGREAGSHGGRAASGYLVHELKKLGVSGAGPDGQFVQEFRGNMRNVLAIAPGRDERLRDEVVVIGAHFDHVGFGSPRNSRGPIGYIHNGADDNASGTAGLLEVIEAIQKLPQPPRRTLLFAFWDGEEQGLLGSSHWVSAPTVALSHVKLAVNVDMIGRLREDGVDVVGWRYACGLRQLMGEANCCHRSPLCPKATLNFTWETVADSDHHPFLTAGIPALMLHTGKHEDYHRPSDDADKLNYEGTQQVTRLLFLLALQAAEKTELPGFRNLARGETKQHQEMLERPLPVPAMRLGVTWNPQFERERIVEVIEVVPQSAADRAGLRVGDRINRFGDHSVRDVADFRSVVATADRDVVTIVERPNHSGLLELSVRLGGEPLRSGIAVRSDDAEPHCLIVTQVRPYSPAAFAGLRPADRIQSLGERPVDGTAEQLLRKEVSLPITVKYERAGVLLTTTLRPITSSTEVDEKLPRSDRIDGP